MPVLDFSKLITESFMIEEAATNDKASIEKADQYTPGEKAIVKGSTTFEKKDLGPTVFFKEAALGSGYAAKKAFAKSYTYNTKNPIVKTK